MLFPVKIKIYLIYKNVDFALFISIRKIIITTNKARDKQYKFMPNMCQHS